MIRHCVFLRFSESVTAEQQQTIYQKIAGLKSVCEGMLSTDYGDNVSPEGLSQGFDGGFIVDFDSAESRDNYLVHPDHQAAGAELVSMLEGGLDGLMVFDLEV